MSSVVTFFVAPDDAEEAVAAWEGLVSGFSAEGPDSLPEADDPRVVAGGDDGGPVVLALSARLVDALGGADPARLHEVAVAWIRQRAEDGETIGPDVAGGILAGLGALAHGRTARDHGLYCWVAQVA
ncbi:hypothetical protein [Streptomyces yaizuensis]|uniref:Uncharacterized protein n=1 Tax=Streptomyces yaizuensis TaxID=2989713 RepID=A0ABQ5P103_9ACTN|nr:hypothetical protein [Streptomyces sp. YSPA8]GLF96289.1 hypothetical protein SYYSPA8_18350 [Streptomyces sp. YSPA8]